MEKKSASNGIGFESLLALLFISLKLMGFIDWSWFWVLSPLWIPVFFVIVVVLIFYVLAR